VQPLGVNFWRVRDVEFGQVDDVHSVGLEGFHEGRLFQTQWNPVRILFLLEGARWVRLEVWDIAANGAFSQPVWIE
jgi:hypothetical protein